MRRVVIALGLLAVALGGWFYVQQRLDREERAARRDARLLEFDEREVTGLAVTLAGVDYRFEIRDDGWWLTEPVLDRADGEMLAELMSLMRRSPVLLTIEDPESPDAYGLAPARLTVRVEGPDVPTLKVGSRAPDASGAYGVVEGRPGVLLIDVTPTSLLTRAEPEAFRERSLMGVPRVAVDAVELAGRIDPPIEIRRGERGWWIERPNRVPASDAAVGRLLDALDTAEIDRWIDGADREDPTFGTGDDAVVVALGTEIGQDRTVRIGNPTNAGMTYAVRDDRSPVFVVRQALLDGFPRSIEELGDVRLTKVNRYQIREFSYVRGGRSFDALRDDASGSWSSGGEPLPEEAVYRFLVKTLEAPVRTWSVAPPPSAEPLAELLWTLNDGTRGRASFWPDRVATVEGIEGLRATLALSPPEIPTF